MLVFDVLDLLDFNDSIFEDVDELYNFFEETLGEYDAGVVLDWAMQAKEGDKYDMFPAAPYIIECREG